MVLMNSMCNKILKPIDGSCCQNAPPLSIIQKLAAVVFLVSIICLLILSYSRQHKSKPITDVESLEEKKPAIAAGHLNPKGPLLAMFKMSLIMLYFYLCDRADIFMKEQKFYTHSSFFIPLIYIFVLGIFYNENSREVTRKLRKMLDCMKDGVQIVVLTQFSSLFSDKTIE